MAKKKITKNSSFNNVKITDADVKKYTKRFTVLSKGKIIGCLAAGVALVGGGVGTAVYFGVNRGTSIVQGSGEIVVDPTIAEDATISEFKTDANGSKVGEVKSSTKKIANVKVSIGSKVLDSSEYEAIEANDETISHWKVTIYKSTIEKYKNQGSFRITPEFESSVDQVVVIFDSNGGTPVNPQTISRGGLVTRPVDPILEGYELKGWYTTDSQGKEVEFDFNTPVNTNLTLRAKWQLPTTTKGLGFMYIDGSYSVYCKDKDQLPSKLKIPETYTDEETGITAKVTSIYNPAYATKESGRGMLDLSHPGPFSNCIKLTEVELPETITYIQDNAFYNCSLLQKINLPDNITYIGKYAFANTYYLKEITLPNKLEILDEYCFAENSLNYIKIPKSVKAIRSYAFFNSPLFYVEMEEGLNEIGENAFADCRYLRDINIPISVTTIGENALRTNGQDLIITLNDDVSSWTDSDGDTIRIEEVTSKLTSGKELEKGFINCTDEEGTDIDFSAQLLGYEESENGVIPICSIRHEEGSQEVTNDDPIEIPETVHIQDSYLNFTVRRIATNFANNTTVTSLKINKNITSIAPGAFYGNDDLTEITFDNEINLERIGDFAFFGCNNLKKFNAEDSADDGTFILPSSLEYVGDCAFYYCAMSKIIINSAFGMNISSVVEDNFESSGGFQAEPSSYYSYPFMCASGGNNNRVTYEVIGDNNLYSNDGNGALYMNIDEDHTMLVALPYIIDDAQDKTVTIPEETQSVSTIAFLSDYACGNVEKIVIPSTLETFNDTFIACDYTYNEEYAVMENLKTFTVAEENEYFSTDDDYPDTLFNKNQDTIIKVAKNGEDKDGNPHSGGYNYEVKGTVTTIGKGAFICDDNLNNINLANVEKIEKFAFYTCDELVTVDLTSAKYIGDNAFCYCDNLNDSSNGLNLNSAKYIGNEAFYECNKLTNLTLNSVEFIGLRAFYGCSSIKEVHIGNKCESIGEFAFYGLPVDDNNPENTAQIYIDSPVIANLEDNKSCIFGNNLSNTYIIYVKSDIPLKLSSLLRTNFTYQETTEGGYNKYTKGGR